MNASAEPCELLPWDTRFFGVSIACVRGNVLTTTTADSVECWCGAHKIQCLYFLARSDDSVTVKLAESRGFHLVDVRVTMDRSLDLSSIPSATSLSSPHRAARNDDIPELRRIARLSHTDTRFFFDDQFTPGQCESLYETWIQSSVEGFAQAVFVIEHSGCVAGYITCHISKEAQEGSIGLIAVDASQQGKGLGRQLVAAAMDWFTARKVPRVSVVTQGRNVAAQRLYARCGFIPRNLELYYHRWFSIAGTDRDHQTKFTATGIVDE